MVAQLRLSSAQYRDVHGLVQKRSGLVFDGSRRHQLERAVTRAVADLELPDTQALVELLCEPERGPTILERLISDLTVGETYFFRHPAQFEALKRYILPELIARRRSSRRLRVWSAGCASGEETYSLAMLLDRALPSREQWDLKILGTDINRSALETARRGVYGSWSFRRMPPALQASYFLRAEGGYSVVPRIRRLVSFAYLNLADSSYPSLATSTYAVDLVLCRNVLIYFDAATAQQVVTNLAASLAKGSWLMVGQSEALPALAEMLSAHWFPGTVAYNKGAAQQRRGETTSAVLTEPAPHAQHAGSAPAVPQPLPPAARKHTAAPAPLITTTHSADSQAPITSEHQLELVLQQEPMLPEAHYLHAMVLAERGELEAATSALRRCLFADPRAVLGHFALAGICARLGRLSRARKAADNVVSLLETMGDSELIVWGDGLTVGQLRDLVNLQQRSWQTTASN